MFFKQKIDAIFYRLFRVTIFTKITKIITKIIFTKINLGTGLYLGEKSFYTSNGLIYTSNVEFVLILFLDFRSPILLTLKSISLFICIVATIHIDIVG